MYICLRERCRVLENNMVMTLMNIKLVCCMRCYSSKKLIVAKRYMYICTAAFGKSVKFLRMTWLQHSWTSNLVTVWYISFWRNWLWPKGTNTNVWLFLGKMWCFRGWQGYITLVNHKLGCCTKCFNSEKLTAIKGTHTFVYVPFEDVESRGWISKHASNKECHYMVSLKAFSSWWWHCCCIVWVFLPP